MVKKISEQTKNNFNFLMDCIAEKTEQGADPKNGLEDFGDELRMFFLGEDKE